MSAVPAKPESRKEKTKVQLTLHANRLKNVAGFGRGTSDPYAVVTLLAADSREKPHVLGKTEVIKNTLSPLWTTPFLLDFEFGKQQHINVGIYDDVRKADDKPMGSATFEIGDILGAKGNIKAKKLKLGGALFARVVKAPEGSGELTLGLRGIKLKNVEGFLRGKSDPFFELCRRIDGAAGSTWRPVYRSPHINDNLNPVWPQASVGLDVLCDGKTDRPIQIAVYDHEKSGKHKPMGIIETSVSRLIAAETPGGTDTSKAFILKWRGKDFGSIVVSAAKINGKGGSAGKARASQEPSAAVSSAGAPPPTNERSKNKAPAAAFVPPPSSSTPPTSAGTPPPTNERSKNEAPAAAFVPPPSSSAPPTYVPTSGGAPLLSSAAVASAPLASAPTFHESPTPSQPTFVDYVSGGAELQMCVAIDFTGSNGDPRIPGTLHYTHRDGQLNDYEKAIKAVGSIVAKYDSDKKFPVYGFGAKYGGVVRHCFQCGPSPEADGIEGVLEAYRSVFRTALTMSGPTSFNEVITLAASQAQKSQDNAQRWGKQSYTVLLILTDGAVSDIEATRQVILAVSNAPLSIVIVGVGRADFSAMQFLDDLHVGPNAKDIVQFVEFEKHRHSKTSLTRATLEEIPDQLVSYFTSRNIMPLPMPRGSRINVVEEEHNEETDIDLSLAFNPDGEVTLNGGGYLDDSWSGTKYGGLSILRPPTAPNGGTPAAAMNYNPAPIQPSSRRLRVQVPPGVSSGMQIQVQNPENRQMMIVTVPQGVVPGGAFDVTY